MGWEHDVRLGPMTRYRIGGPAGRFAEPVDREELTGLVAGLEGETCRVLGGGANVLVADRGLDGPVIRLGEGFARMELEEGRFEAGAAVRLPSLVSAARDAGLTGYVGLEAVPGTVGGGLRMNAGSTDEWIWHRVRWAEAMTPAAEVVRLGPEEAGPGYRSVGVPEGWVFLGAGFEAEVGDPAQVLERHREFRRRKVASQVYDLRSVGSTWKNPGPPHGSAWQVVEEVGMRGETRGGAQVSTKHANFIVNRGDARAEDVHGLMEETHRRAREALGLRLEPEIRLWGFTAEELEAVGAEPDGHVAAGAAP